MAGTPTPIPTPSPPPEPSWSSVFKDKALIVTLVVTTQFFVLIVLFSQRPSQMAMEAKGIILQTYVVAFTACWSYFLRGVVEDRVRALLTPPVPVEPVRQPQPESQLVRPS
jgi:hypothetical protein